MKKGADAKKRKIPKLIAHIPVVYSNDFKSVLIAAHKKLNRYGKMDYYKKMFSDAGFHVDASGDLSADLIQNLVVYGTDATIHKKLEHIKSAGIDELLIQPVIVENQKSEELAIMNIIGN